MKKQLFLIAATLMLGMTACQKEEQIVPINGGNDTNENVMVKSAADLIGTDWTYTYNDTITFGDTGCDSIDGIVLNFQFGLSFDSSYAHLTFPENVIAFDLMADGDEYGLQEVANMNFAYTYDPTLLPSFCISPTRVTRTTPMLSRWFSPAPSKNNNVKINIEGVFYRHTYFYSKSVIRVYG